MISVTVDEGCGQARVADLHTKTLWQETREVQTTNNSNGEQVKTIGNRVRHTGDTGWRASALKREESELVFKIKQEMKGLKNPSKVKTRQTSLRCDTPSETIRS